LEKLQLEKLVRSMPFRPKSDHTTSLKDVKLIGEDKNPVVGSRIEEAFNERGVTCRIGM
jgi:hypothetical protein